MSRPEAIVIGAGLAGLSCARELVHAGVETEIWEASDGVGGRVRTDLVEGFLLDRGFQVLLTAYPECKRALDYGELDLQTFFPGALVRFEGRFHRIGDPWRAPSSALPTLFSPVGSLADKLRIARLRASTAQYSIEQIFQRHEVSALERLREAGFSAAMIDRFFRPFFGGIFLEPKLETSSRMFDFVFRMLSDGDIAVPARGMGAIPEQLAAALPAGAIHLNRTVQSLQEIPAPFVIVATDGPEAARLLGTIPRPGSRGVWCYYFAATKPPVDENVILLNGDGTGPVNNCCVMTSVAKTYGPAGAALIAATVLGTETAHSEAAVRQQMAEWFGAQVAAWRLLRTYYVPHAQPDQTPPALEPSQRPVRLRGGLYVCGDHRDNASLNGAMISGRRAAEAVLADRHATVAG